MLTHVIAIDFDGCICENQWPDCGAPNMDVIEEAKAARANGSELILWTCRSGKDLTDAVEYCKQYGLEFDAVNENVDSRKDEYMNDCRKVWADEYWDDRAVLKRYGDKKDTITVPFVNDPAVNRFMDAIYNIPAPCRMCPNHPTNGGSGVCHCILGQEVAYC